MAREELGARPVFTNSVKGFTKHKTKDGYSFDSAFMKRYYSSLDAELYFGNEFVDEIVFITFNVVQQQTPLFGYNSYVYDEIAQGSRIIQGQFAINFTSPNYLGRLLESAKGDSITNMGDYTTTKTLAELTVEERKTTGTVINSFDDHKPLWPQTFDIDIIFGNKTALGTPVHLVLEGVQIGNAQYGLSTSGDPVVETYSFIARDLKTIE